MHLHFRVPTVAKSSQKPFSDHFRNMPGDDADRTNVAHGQKRLEDDTQRCVQSFTMNRRDCATLGLTSPPK